MHLAKTITQLDIGDVAPERALELGQMGYLQWLGALPAMSNYREEALRAHAKATPFSEASPAINVFCELLINSLRTLYEPVTLRIPDRQRRGGSRARRAGL